MKKITGLSFLVFISISSCQNNNDSVSPTTSQVVTSGTWRVSLFIDSGNDETSDFTGFSFTFNQDGSLSASRNTFSRTGTWSVNSSSNRFIIDLGPKITTNEPLGELTDDWVILSQSNTELKLSDDNVASNEFLTFTRN